MFKTPWKATVVVGMGTAVLAGLFPIEDLVQMTNIGTLFAFAVVCGAVLVMRYTNPTVARPFQSGVSALLYIDRRMRAEGLDLTLAQAASADPT